MRRLVSIIFGKVLGEWGENSLTIVQCILYDLKNSVHLKINFLKHFKS